MDRTEAKDLVVVDDKHLYSRHDIENMIAKIQHENKRSASAIRKASAHAILGFVRLLEGYYLILVTKRRQVAQIGHHVIYKIDETSIIYIPAGEGKISAEEKRYLRIFQNVDLSSNFYFSYSYDLTHSLQYNMSPSLQADIGVSDTPWNSRITFRADDGGKRRRRHSPNMKFVWNSFLLKDWDLHPEWKLFMIHGFVSQANISVYGQAMYLTLISRRSAKNAGTRFLKRGANLEGDVANEVETEQIVHDSSVSSFKSGRFTSFVQMRGSVPSHWSQDVSKMVPKPLITLDIADPYHKTSGLHFNQLLQRYGSPIIVLNLVKSNEKRRPHETVLSNEFISAIQYLNQFIPPQHSLIHLPYDMAHVNKTKNSNVMAKLSDIAFDCIRKTGIFRSWPGQINPTDGGVRFPSGRQLQTGVVRVNCVDCLDRTNTAAFALGKAALGLQLHALGVLLHPELDFDTDTVRMLEELYEDQGDTIALQYGGSQLVHRIKTYRKIAPLSSHSRDIMQTLSRYYSNTFSDADKQNAINLFLGVFVPYNRPKFMPDIWDLPTDFYLHNPISVATERMKDHLAKPLTCWWDEKNAACLPLPSDLVLKGNPGNAIDSDPADVCEENTDGYVDQYRPHDLKTLHETLSFQMLHTSKDFTPTSATDFSPFKVRGRPNKRKESAASNSYKFIGSLFNFGAPGSPSQPFTSSPSPSEADSSDDFTEEPVETPSSRSNSLFVDNESVSSIIETPPSRTFEYLLGRPEDSYGKVMSSPVVERDEKLYAEYSRFAEFPTTETPICNADTQDGIETGIWQPLDPHDKLVFHEYVRRGNVHEEIVPSPSDLQLYKAYLTSCQL